MPGLLPLHSAPDRGSRPLVEVRSEWRWVDGQRIHYRTAQASVPGDRLPVVLVHGFVISSRFLVPLIERLGLEFPVTAPDLPGFGRSDKPKAKDALSVARLADALAESIDAAGFSRVALLGNSLGCQIAVECAARYPQLIAGVILQGPTIDRHARSGGRQVLRNVINGGREERMGIAPLIDYLQAGPQRVMKMAHEMINHPIEETLPHLQMPALVVRGSEDPLVPQDWASEVTGLLPNGRLVVVPGAAHAMVSSNALELTRVCRPFLLALGRDELSVSTAEYIEVHLSRVVI